MNADDEELLAHALADESELASPKWKEALARDPTLAARWTELSALLRSLERTGADERASLEAATKSMGAADVELVRRVFQKHVARTARSPRTLVYLAASVLIAVGIFVVVNRDSKTDHGDDVFLGDERYRCIEPTLETGDAHLFRWTGDLPPAGKFVVRIFELDVADGSTGRLALQSPRCAEPSWQPTASEFERIPAEFVWEVEVLKSGGEHHALSARQRALRSR
jgi:hypothetical protein